MRDFDTVEDAAARVDFRLTYARTPEPRRCHDSGIDGDSEIPNAYYGRGNPDSSVTGSGSWEDPEFWSAIQRDGDDEEAMIRRWFVTAVREAIHEALEWFWVDDETYLNPHGRAENAIHEVSERAAVDLLKIRGLP